MCHYKYIYSFSSRWRGSVWIKLGQRKHTAAVSPRASFYGLLPPSLRQPWYIYSVLKTGGWYILECIQLTFIEYFRFRWYMIGTIYFLLDLQWSSTDVIHSGSLDFPSGHISGCCFPQYCCSLSSSGCTEFVQSPMYKAFTKTSYSKQIFFKKKHSPLRPT